MENDAAAIPPELELNVSVKDDHNVSVVQLGEKEIVLVGTAHVSRSSAELVERAIRELKPNSVAVELCSGRYDALKDPDRWKNTNLMTVIRAGKAHLLLAQLLLSSFQRKIAKQMGVRPGEEMLRAISVADELNLPTVLADRDVSTTLRRTWASLKWSSIAKIGVSGVMGALEDEKISEEEIERLKTSDALEEALKELSGALPEVRASLIDERDRYLAQKISESPGPRVVAIIGAGHMTGVRSYLGIPQDLAELEKLPPPKKKGKALKLILLALFITALVLALRHGGLVLAEHILLLWALPCAIAGALGAVLALAHPLTILATFLAAPFAALNPFKAMGWMAGLLEARIRQPRVADFESLLDDISSTSGVWRNRVSRILLLVVATNLTVALGNGLGFVLLAKSVYGMLF